MLCALSRIIGNVITQLGADCLDIVDSLCKATYKRISRGGGYPRDKLLVFLFVNVSAGNNLGLDRNTHILGIDTCRNDNNALLRETLTIAKHDVAYAVVVTAVDHNRACGYGACRL